MQLYILILIPISSIEVSAFVLHQRTSCNPSSQLSYKETCNNEEAIPSFSIEDNNHAALHEEGVVSSNNTFTCDSDVSSLLKEARVGFEEARMKAIEDDATKALDEADRLWREAEEELLQAEMELMAIQGEEDMLLAEEMKAMEFTTGGVVLSEESAREQYQSDDKESEDSRRAIQKCNFATSIEKTMTRATEDTSKRSVRDTEETPLRYTAAARIERAKEMAKSSLLEKHLEYELNAKARERARGVKQRSETRSDDDAAQWRRLRELNEKIVTRRNMRKSERRATADEMALRERDEMLLREWKNKATVVGTTECAEIDSAVTEIDDIAEIIKQGYMICF
mmetsp:Transcript_19826/g.24440  ORF Transcript_19826/g.24440 Transcript_19826/m.24440 type:complete len:340 (-) Transcript_19826:236-1255(-)